MESKEVAGEKKPYWATRKEVSAWLACSECHIARMVSRGRFPRPSRCGRLLRFRWSDLEEWANGIAKKEA